MDTQLQQHNFKVKKAISNWHMIEVLEKTSQMIQEVEEQLEKYVEEDEEVQLLQTTPGVGKIRSATIVARIGDINNFESYKQFASYCGRAPYLKESKENTLLGHITKRGPQELRTALVLVVMGLLRLQ